MRRGKPRNHAEGSRRGRAKEGEAKKRSSPRRIDNLEGLLRQKLAALYDIESELVKALPAMAAAATSIELKAGFRDHLEETRVHVERLERAFEMLGEKPRKTRVAAIRGLVEDAKSNMRSAAEGPALDSLLVASAAYVEHYEMAGYLSATRWARELGMADMAGMLAETLKEEQAADERMTMLAEKELDAEATEMERVRVGEVMDGEKEEEERDWREDEKEEF